MLQIYNTASRRKEEFRPIDKRHVRMYVCGPTVYDFAHIGNARPVVVFDVRVPPAQAALSEGHLCPQHHGRGRQDQRARQGDRRGHPHADRADGAAVPRGYCRAGRAAAGRRAARDRAYRGDDRHHQRAARQGLCLSRGRPCAVPRAVDAELRRAVRAQPRRADRRRPRRGRALQARPGGFRAVEAERDDAARLGQPVGPRPAGLAYRMLGDEHEVSRRQLRHPWRRARPDLPAPRERDRAEPLRASGLAVREILDAQRLSHGRRREDVEVARQLLHHPRIAGRVPGRGDPARAAADALPPAARLHQGQPAPGQADAGPLLHGPARGGGRSSPRTLRPRT